MRGFLACLAPVIACLPVSTASAQQPKDSGSEAYKSVIKSTVWIHSQHGRALATGTGSVIDKNARLILTNYHVVGDNKRTTVFFPAYRDGKPIPEKKYYTEREKTLGIRGDVLEIDKSADLAIIRLERIPAGVQELKLAGSSPDPGQTIHSVGNPGGSGALWVYTPGKVRAVYQKTWKAKLEDKVVTFKAKVVETDSATNPGDSGGPLVNDKVELVGVTQGGAIEAQLISTFVDISEVKRLLARPDLARLRTKSRDDADSKTITQAPRVGPPVSTDAAKLFSEPVWKQLGTTVAALHKEKKTDLAVETVLTPPGQTVEAVRKMSGTERLSYFREVAIARMKGLQIDGVYVLICKDPGFVYIEVTSEAKAAFPEDFRKTLQDAILAQFKEKKFDDGLKQIIVMTSKARGLEVKP
jgi:V8-like Glu-specific endopeptidase